MAMLELEVPEKPPPLPPSNFSHPLPTPPLQWARRKRLRCSNAFLDHPSPSPDPPPSTAPDRSPLLAPHHSPSPLPSSPVHDWHRTRTPRKEEGVEAEENGKGKAVTGDDAGERKVEGSGEGWFLRSRAPGRAEKAGKKKAELWISLSREEIEEDFYSFTCCKLPRRPKKRSKTFPPNLLARIFPGSWLPNAVTPEMYKVHEHPESRKR